MSASPAARPLLRRERIAQRDALPAAWRSSASLGIAQFAARLPHFRPGSAIAMFASFGSEVDTAPLMALALARGARVYLPRITPGPARRMRMTRYRGRLGFLNRHRIAEPPPGEALPAAAFDLVLVPLVAFDHRGYRLGYGGGYYDRWLAGSAGRHLPPRIGVAFSSQELPHIDAQPHDVRLHGVLSERGLRWFAPFHPETP